MLAHLAEVDARGAYRQWACETLAAYCVYELRLSEDEAQRRCRAARVMRKFPVLFEMLAEASIHLTGILMLAPHLTEDNHLGLLARARYRRKRELEKLVAELAPARDVPALVEPLGVKSIVPPRASSSWQALVTSATGWVRKLEPGEGPASAPAAADEWHETVLASVEWAADGMTLGEAAQASDGAMVNEAAALAAAAASAVDGGGFAGDREQAPAEPEAAAAPARAESEGVAVRYRVQFTADERYVELLERARALLWHQVPNGDLARIHQLAMKALVAQLLRRKCGVGEGRELEPRDRTGSAKKVDAVVATARSVESAPSLDQEASPAPARDVDATLLDLDTLQGKEAPSALTRELALSSQCQAFEKSTAPARNVNVSRPSGNSDASAAPARKAAGSDSRHIPSAVRREVWLRDGARCTYVDLRGQRCRAVAALEFHHEHPHARGGAPTVDNLRLCCRAHNQLAAEQDFGRDFMQRASVVDRR